MKVVNFHLMLIFVFILKLGKTDEKQSVEMWFVVMQQPQMAA